MEPWSMGSMIRELRKIAQVSQDVLAEATGLSSTTISRYERGKQIPSKVSLDKIMAYFQSMGVDWRWNSMLSTSVKIPDTEALKQSAKLDDWVRKNIYQGGFIDDGMDFGLMRDVYMQVGREEAWIYIQICLQNQELLRYYRQNREDDREEFQHWCTGAILDVQHFLEKQIAYHISDLQGYIKGEKYLPLCSLDERRLLNIIGILSYQIGDYVTAGLHFQLLKLMCEQQEIQHSVELCVARFNLGMTWMEQGNLIYAMQEILAVVEEYFFYGNLTLGILLIWGRLELEQRLGWKQLAEKDGALLSVLILQLPKENQCIDMIHKTEGNHPLIWYF